jgi:hypothetical protein
MKTVKIFVHDPVIELDCAHALASALKPTFKVQMLTLDTLADGIWDADILAIGGGIGDSDLFQHVFTTNHLEAIKQYMHGGGKYLGICMGAYWADKLYFGLTDMCVRQYVRSPGSDIQYEGPTYANVRWLDEYHQMYFYDGCTFYNLPGRADVYASYCANTMPMAVIDGDVGLVGCHPESENWWFDKYNPRHNELLHDFAVALLYS